MSAEEKPVEEATAEVAEVKEANAVGKEVKKVAKPDEAAHREALAAEDERLAAKNDRLAVIKATLEQREGSRSDNTELALAKQKYNEARMEGRRAHTEKRQIYDEISTADELKKQQQDLTQRLGEELKNLDLGIRKNPSDITVADIEAKIKALELRQQTTSLSIKEDKKIMEEIKRLVAKKPVIKQYDEAKESLEGVRKHHNNLYAQLKLKNTELAELKGEEEKLKGKMDEVEAKEKAKRSDLPALYKERDQIKKEIGEIRDEMRRIRDEYNEQRREYFAYSRYLRELKQAEWQERQKEKKALEEARRKEEELEEAKRDPWELEKAICEQLILYVEKYLPKKEEAKVEASKEREVPAGMAVRCKDDDDEAALAALKGKKGKKKAQIAAAFSAPLPKKTVKLSHPPDSFEIWGKLGFKPPVDTGECIGLHAQLLEKREWLKTAPPKEKKKKVPPVEEAPGEEHQRTEAFAADEALTAEGGATMSDAAWKEHEAAELKAKQEAEAKKAAEKAKLEEENLKRARELESSGKKVSGGMHKFDASEVDVNGGDATTDDFLDAFGFGGDDAPADEAPAEAATAEAGASASDMVSIKATSSSTVSVALNLGASQ